MSYGRNPGYGYGRGYGRGGRGGRGYGMGAGGQCVCPKCGYREAHQPGVPCTTLYCPNCGSIMMRDFGQNTGPFEPQQFPNQRGFSAQRNTTVINHPVVDQSKCIGCAICAQHCPFGAIEIKNGKAFIHPELCRNCRVCINYCPKGAIN